MCFSTWFPQKPTQAAFSLHSLFGLSEPCHGILHQLTDGPRGHLAPRRKLWRHGRFGGVRLNGELVSHRHITCGAMCVYVYIYIYTHSYMYPLVHACMHAYIYIYVPTCYMLYVYIYIFIYLHIYICIHMHMYIYIYMHMHMFLYLYMIYMHIWFDVVLYGWIRMIWDNWFTLW
jgi:hypothetical protein